MLGELGDCCDPNFIIEYGLIDNHCLKFIKIANYASFAAQSVKWKQINSIIIITNGNFNLFDVMSV